MHVLCIEKDFMQMDKFDWKIIHALQENGRLTNQEIGDLIGLSASQCSRRRQLLEQKGVILGYSARIQQRALGLDVTALVHVNLKVHDHESNKAFKHLIESEDFIQDAYSISGDADFILKVVAENSEQLSHFLTERLLTCTFISHVKSYIVLKKYKDQFSQIDQEKLSFFK